MSKLKFTLEQQKELMENPFTLCVSEKQIAFTKEFKEYFWHCITLNRDPVQIFRDCGYNPQILGKDRIKHLYERVKLEAASGNGFKDCGSGKYQKKKIDSLEEEALLDPMIEVKRLQDRVLYLEQQMEFIKKITSLKTSRK